MCQVLILAFRPTNLDFIMENAVRDIGTEGASSLIFAMANWDVLIVKLPSVLASLAMTSPGKDLGRSFVVGVQSERDLQLCQRIHSTCWLDDLQTVPYEEASKWQAEGHVVNILAWRKVQVAR
jgi:hypothetical protein